MIYLRTKNTHVNSLFNYQTRKPIKLEKKAIGGQQKKQIYTLAPKINGITWNVFKLMCS